MIDDDFDMNIEQAKYSKNFFNEINKNTIGASEKILLRNDD